MERYISIATNVSLTDGPTLLKIVPHWLRVFGKRVREVVIVVDDQPVVGRIADLHGEQASIGQVLSAVRKLEQSDSRVRSVALGSLEVASTQRRWFGKARPVRCQAGTPILAFAAAVDQAREDLVLRCDSDMLFCERGWLSEAMDEVGAGTHVYEPPRFHSEPGETVSCRAFMVSQRSLGACLPLLNLKLDLARRLHRGMTGRPTWLALEQMMERSVREGEIRHRIGAKGDSGFSLHALRRNYIAESWFVRVIDAVECNQVPKAQQASWDLLPEAWGFRVTSPSLEQE
jgi:hypothetical protein